MGIRNVWLYICKCKLFLLNQNLKNNTIKPHTIKRWGRCSYLSGSCFEIADISATAGGLVHCKVVKAITWLGWSYDRKLKMGWRWGISWPWSRFRDGWWWWICHQASLNGDRGHEIPPSPSWVSCHLALTLSRWQKGQQKWPKHMSFQSLTLRGKNIF